MVTFRKYSSVKQNLTMNNRSVSIIVGILIIASIIVVSSVVGYFVIENHSYSSSSISKSSSCSGYPPLGDCHANYDYTFSVLVNYSGSWSVNYSGWHNVCDTCNFGSNKSYTTGTYSGTGMNTTTITLSGDDYFGLQLCATAHKLDGSNSTLTIQVGGPTSTSSAYGSTSSCAGGIP